MNFNLSSAHSQAAPDIAIRRNHEPVSNTLATPQPLLAPKGTWFNETIDFRDPEGDAITQQVLAQLAAIENRKRKRREADEISHYNIVRKILANGFRCEFHRKPPLVAYLRKADGYKEGPRWLTGTGMRRTVDLLVKAGLLKASKGKWGEVASTYWITGRLHRLAEACGATSSSLTSYLPPDSLVRLRTGNSQTQLAPYRHTDDTRRWMALLQAYNAFIDQQDIGLSLPPEEEAEWVRRWNDNREGAGAPLYRPELFQTGLYRQFNNGSFDEGGRMYGAWWITIPKALRRKITINGKPTVELDFSGCAIRMLYHERGLAYEGDPYRLDAIASYEEEKGLQPGYFREGVKAMTQALINGRSDGKPEQIRFTNGFSFKPFSRPEVRRMIEEKHQSIMDAFGTGAGLGLQRKDSDLALAIITELREQGIPALPIHDSFIVAEEHRDGLLSSMQDRYRKMVGFECVIN